MTNALALEHPDLLVGIQVSLLAEPYLGPGSPPLSPEERALVGGRPEAQERSGAYAHVQRTMPQLIGLALGDSPAGLAAWIVHFWREWSDCGGDVERRFSKDELLTTVTLVLARALPARVGRARVRRHPALDGAAARWALRPDGGAGAAGGGDPRVLPAAAERVRRRT